VVEAGEASWAIRRGYRNLTDTMWDTRPENMPATSTPFRRCQEGE
jgi:hypothetical protein